MFRKNIAIADAQLFSRNFSGRPGPYNPEGQRNFCVFLSDDIAEQLLEDGWNVKQLQPRDENEQPRSYIQVKVSYKNIPPKVVLVTSKGKSILDESTVQLLDFAEIENVDVIISPSHWEMNGRTGTAAYLKSIYVTIAEDEFEAKYYSTPDSAYDAVGGCGRCEECDGHCKDY